MHSKIKIFSESIQKLRDFFFQAEFHEVLTPPAVACPGIEPHLHPLKVQSANEKIGTNHLKQEIYLQTSPEFWMKSILAFTGTQEIKNLYTLSYCFRDEPMSQWHRPQFLMLEWYRKEVGLNQIMQDCNDLLQSLCSHQDCKYTYTEATQKTVRELFRETLDVDLFEMLDASSIYKYIKASYPHLHPQCEGIENEWEDLFFILFLNEVEPIIKNYSNLFLTEYPAQLAALSTINESDPRVCNRFEWYLNGVEVGNCFEELTDLKEQRARAKKDLSEKQKRYEYQVSEPDVLFNALEKGLPKSCGIAVGFERVLKIIFEDKNYDFQFFENPS